MHCASDEQEAPADGTIDGEGARGLDGSSPSDVNHAADAAPEPDASVHEAGAPAPPVVDLPRLGLGPDELGVIVNDRDPQSVAVADYYVARRKIPAANLVHLAFDPPGNALTPDAFAPLYAAVQAALPATVQGLAVTWTKPYLVGGESVTTAFAVGYDAAYTNTTGGQCGATKQVPTYDAATTRPFTDQAVRPTMMLAAADVDHAKRLIDRGIAADHTFPSGEAWLMNTNDPARSVRAYTYPQVVADWSGSDLIHATYVDNSGGGGSNVVTDRPAVAFYFQGLASVDGIETNTYVPGAIADHLTSYGGQVPDSWQMSIVRWLEAGATGSYGTAVEPCNYTTKFSDAGIVMRRYVRGEPLLFAYWKSVAWPGEGVFVGEPLASPWGQETSFEGGTLRIRTTALEPGAAYDLVAKSSAADAGTVVQSVTVPATPVASSTSIVLPGASAPFYALVKRSDGG